MEIDGRLLRFGSWNAPRSRQAFGHPGGHPAEVTARLSRAGRGRDIEPSCGLRRLLSKSAQEID